MARAERGRWVVESLGDSTARVEVGDEVVQIPRALLPDDVQEGDVLAVSITRDPEATKAALAESEKQIQEAPVDRSSGDIAL